MARIPGVILFHRRLAINGGRFVAVKPPVMPMLYLSPAANGATPLVTTVNVPAIVAVPMTFTALLLPVWLLSRRMIVVDVDVSTRLLEQVSVPTTVPALGDNVPVPVNTTLPEMVPKPLTVPDVLVTATDTASTPPERLREFPAVIAIVEALETVPLAPMLIALPEIPVLPTVIIRFPASQMPPP